MSARRHELGFQVAIKKMPFAVMSLDPSIRAKKESRIFHNPLFFNGQGARFQRHMVIGGKRGKAVQQTIIDPGYPILKIMEIIPDGPELRHHQYIR